MIIAARLDDSATASSRPASRFDSCRTYPIEGRAEEGGPELIQAPRSVVGESAGPEASHERQPPAASDAARLLHHEHLVHARRARPVQAQAAPQLGYIRVTGTRGRSQ